MGWLKRFLCKHEYEEMQEPLMWFFGKTKCHKCGDIGQTPEEQMTISTFTFPIKEDV